MAAPRSSKQPESEAFGRAKEPRSFAKAELKPKHKRSLRKFTKFLHGLGINVSEHIEQLELDEEELQEARQKIGRESFLKLTDKTRLKQILAKADAVMRATVKLEDVLWEEVAPLTIYAYQKMLFSSELIELRAAREIYEGWYQKRAAELKADIPAARKFVLASIAKEHSTFFQNYPRLLSSIENTVSELVGIELKYGAVEHPSAGEFSDLNKLLRKILHEDAYFLTKDIAKIYDRRVEVYNWIIEADAEVKPHIVPTAAQEKLHLISARNFYLGTYRQHLKKITQIYLGGVKG